jgi:hypothetical protein
VLTSSSVARRPIESAGAQFRHPGPTIGLLALGSALAVGVATAVNPAFGLLVVIGVAVALAFSQRADLAVYVLVAVAPACAGLHRGLLFPGLRVSEAAIAGIGVLVLVFAARTPRPAWSRVELLLLAYAAATLCLGGFDLLQRHAALTTEDLGTLVGPLQFVLLLRAVVVSLPEERQRLVAARLLIGVATLVALVALAQYANAGPTRHLLAQLTGGSLYTATLEGGVPRVTGPFNIWHELAGFLMPSILLALALALDEKAGVWRTFYVVAFVVCLMALVTTAAVGILTITTLSCFYLAWRRRVLHLALVVAVPVVLVVALLVGNAVSDRVEQNFAPTATTYRIPFAPQTISYRYALFREQNAPALEGHWVTGYGPDLPPRLALGNFPFAETTYVTLLFRGGVPLLAIFLLLTIAVISAARRAQLAAASHLEWSVATVVFTTTVGYLLLQLIESYMTQSGPPHTYWVYVGLMLAAGGVRAKGTYGASG